MNQQPENNLIIFYGGIGDTLLWIPTLKAFVIKPDVIFLYDTPVLNILKENELVNNVFELKTKVQLINFALKNSKQYDNIFLNHLCGGQFLLKMMNRCSNTVISNSPNFGEKHESKLHQKNPKENIHDSLQNFLLVHGRIPELKPDSFKLNTPTISQHNLPSAFITIQLGAGNNQTPYKNWPIKNWEVFINSLIKSYPEKKFILLGSNDEIELVKQLNINNSNLSSLVGKTSVAEAFNILAKSDLFIGPDGGLMHIAASVGVPTFTIWGGSSPILYGYELILGKHHYIVKQNLDCMPCNAWINANKSKTSDPLKCPDFVCMHSLSPEEVLKAFNSFYLVNK